MKKYKLGSILKLLAKEQRTGTLMCVGEDNVLGRIYLVDGKPRAARCRNFQGKEAMLQINEKLLTSLKFHKDVNLVKSQSTIEGNVTPDFVATAEDDTVETAPRDALEEEFKSALDMASLAGGDDDARLSGMQLTGGIRVLLANELVNFIGPIAQMVVSDLEDGISVQQALAELAQEIGEIDPAIEYVEKIRGMI